MGYKGICLWFSESSLYKSSAKTLWFSASVPLSGFVPWWWRYTVSPSVHPTNIRVYMRIYIYTHVYIYIYMFRSRYLHVFFLSVCMHVIYTPFFNTYAFFSSHWHGHPQLSVPFPGEMTRCCPSLASHLNQWWNHLDFGRVPWRQH